MTLKDDDIVTRRVPSRRKFIAGAGGAVAGAIGVITASPAAAGGDNDKKDGTVVDNDGRDGTHMDGDGKDHTK